MFHAKTLASAGLMAVLMTGTAHAALTADQIWAGWQENAAAAGLSLVAENKTTEGDVTKLTGVTVGPAVPGEASATGSIAEITMTQAADGSVAIAFAPEFTLPIQLGDNGGQVTVSHENMTLTAREANGGTAYDYAGDMLTIAADFAYKAEAMDGSGPQDASVDMTMNFVKPVGTYADTPGANRKINIVHASDSLDYTLAQIDPSMDTNTQQTAKIADVKLTYDMTMPATQRISEIDSGAAFSRALMDGLAVKLDMSQGVAEQTDKTQNMFLTYDAKVTSQPGNGSFSLDKTGGGMVATGGGTVADITSPSFPFPVLHIEMAGVGMDFRVPVTGTESVPFRYMIKLDSLTVNEEAWAVVDPGKVLSRDPATLALDLTGKAAMDLGALLDTESTGGPPNPMPSIETLDIAGLNLSVAGAQMTGTGAFTFDDSTGVPMPRGAADVSLTGGNTLIDGLVAIGVLPEDQAASTRMMMSMFMTPGEGTDTMTSKIEARDDGGIYVNGQRVQ
jgi:Uncharacterized protein conserved in bacteria (DUF2125)